MASSQKAELEAQPNGRFDVSAVVSELANFASSSWQYVALREYLSVVVCLLI